MGKINIRALFADLTARFVVFRAGDGKWINVDRRWRKRRELFPANEHACECEPGVSGHFRVVEHREPGFLVCTVRHLAKPDDAIASGVYRDDTWHFDGHTPAWANVSEYVLVPAEDGRRHLLRIADGATLDPLEHLGVVQTVCAVPNSRLVVLASQEHLTVWDHLARRAGAHLRLARETADDAAAPPGVQATCPMLSFRNGGQELWVNNDLTILKLETKQWTVTDAAGCEGPEDTPDERMGPIRTWSFDPSERHCIVVRDGRKDVLVIDVETMLPAGQAMFREPQREAVQRGSSILGLDVKDRLSERRIYPSSPSS